MTKEKLSLLLSLIDSLLASGLNEPALLKQRENIKRPENCKLCCLTKVNSEFWDIATKKKTAQSIDALLQKVQKPLVNGIIPTAWLMGTMGDVNENKWSMGIKQSQST